MLVSCGCYLSLISLSMWQQIQCFLLILSVVLTGSLSVAWKILVPAEVTVSRGDNAVLNCSFNKQGHSGMIRVKWLARESKAPPFFTCSVKNDSMERANDCSDSRLGISLNGDPRRGDLSLIIRKVQLTDNGIYICRVELDSQGGSSEKQIKLHVTAKPQILSLSVTETTSSSDSASRRLKCEVEGHPLPKIVWLSSSRFKIEKQDQTFVSGPYQRISSVPYPEEQVLTCRAESALGEAERMYPTNYTLMISLTVCGLVLLLLVSTGVIVYCWRKTARVNASAVYVNAEVVAKHQPRRSDSPAEAPIQLVYSTIITTSSAPFEIESSAQQHEEPGVFYSAVKLDE